MCCSPALKLFYIDAPNFKNWCFDFFKTGPTGALESTKFYTNFNSSNFGFIFIHSFAFGFEAANFFGLAFSPQRHLHVATPLVKGAAFIVVSILRRRMISGTPRVANM